MKTLQYIAISASALLIVACSSTYYASSSSGENDGIYYSGQRSSGSEYYTNPQNIANRKAAEQLYNKTQTAINSSEQPAVGSGQSAAGNMQKVDNSTQYTAGNEAVTDVIIDEDDSYARRLQMFDNAEYERPSNAGVVNINLVGAGYPSYYAWYGNYYNPWHWRYSTYYHYPWYWDSWYYPYYYPSYHYAWYGYGHYYHTPYYYYPHYYYNHHHHNNYYANNARNRRGAPTIGARHTNRSQARLPQIQQVNSNRRQTAQYGRNASTSTNVRNTGYRRTAGVNNAVNTSNESGRYTQRQYTRVNRNTDNSQRYYNTNTPTTNTNVNNNRSNTVNYRRSDSNSSRYNNTNTSNTYNVSNTNTNSSQPSYSRESRPSSSSSGATSSGRSSGSSSSGRRR